MSPAAAPSRLTAEREAIIKRCFAKLYPRADLAAVTIGEDGPHVVLRLTQAPPDPVLTWRTVVGPYHCNFQMWNADEDEPVGPSHPIGIVSATTPPRPAASPAPTAAARAQQLLDLAERVTAAWKAGEAQLAPVHPDVAAQVAELLAAGEQGRGALLRAVRPGLVAYTLLRERLSDATMQARLAAADAPPPVVPSAPSTLAELRQQRAHREDEGAARLRQARGQLEATLRELAPIVPLLDQAARTLATAAVQAAAELRLRATAMSLARMRDHWQQLRAEGLVVDADVIAAAQSVLPDVVVPQLQWPSGKDSFAAPTLAEPPTK